MLREAIKKLYEWKLKKDRRPLIIRGARQVGKTWLVEEFSPCLSIRASLLPFIDQGWLINIPLYAVSEIGKTLDSQEKV